MDIEIFKECIELAKLTGVEICVGVRTVNDSVLWLYDEYHLYRKINEIYDMYSRYKIGEKLYFIKIDDSISVEEFEITSIIESKEGFFYKSINNEIMSQDSLSKTPLEAFDRKIKELKEKIINCDHKIGECLEKGLADHN